MEFPFSFVSHSKLSVNKCKIEFTSPNNILCKYICYKYGVPDVIKKLIITYVHKYSFVYDVTYTINESKLLGTPLVIRGIEYEINLINNFFNMNVSWISTGTIGTIYLDGVIYNCIDYIDTLSIAPDSKVTEKNKTYLGLHNFINCYLENICDKKHYFPSNFKCINCYLENICDKKHYFPSNFKYRSRGTNSNIYIDTKIGKATYKIIDEEQLIVVIQILRKIIDVITPLLEKIHRTNVDNELFTFYTYNAIKYYPDRSKVDVVGF
jgi:hypothetical protein